MTTTDHQRLTQTLSDRGWTDGPLHDDLLDTLASDLALAAELLHAELDTGAYPPSIPDLDRFLLVVAGLDHVLASIACLDRFIARRRRAVEAKGVTWDRHLDDLERWRDEQRRDAA